MEQHCALAPICTIKARHLKCPQCHMKLKGKLQKLDGVEDTIIDPEQGLLKVSGKIDPTVLLKAVQEVTKSAELWSFQREPSQTNTKQFQIGKDCPCDGHDCDEVSSDDESSYNAPTKQPKKQKGILSWVKKEKKSGGGIPGMNMLKPGSLSMPQPRGRPPMRLPPPMGMGIPAHRNFYGPPRPGYPPPRSYYPSYHGPSPSPYGYYGQMQPPYYYYRSMSPPKVNPMIHYTSYLDNIRHR